MKAIGRVVSIENNVAVIESVRQSACASCHNCENSGSCHAELIFGNQEQIVKTTACNDVDAKVGDTVELFTSTGITMLSSASMFVVPVILSVIIYVILSKFSVSQYICALALIFVFVTGFGIIAKIIDRYIKKSLKIRIVKILKESEI